MIVLWLLIALLISLSLKVFSCIFVNRCYEGVWRFDPLVHGINFGFLLIGIFIAFLTHYGHPIIASILLIFCLSPAITIAALAFFEFFAQEAAVANGDC